MCSNSPTVWVIAVIYSVAMVDSMLLQPASKNEGNFKLMYEAKSPRTNIPITFYTSEKSGLNVIIAQVEGPLVNGFFTVVTEAHDDDGLPHTLEHLVFLGSEDYPYKGILDLFANRCLAAGTNAWTDTDHTSYTVETGGSEGFLNILPVYLDHLLYPTLTKSGYITEVYHVTETGEDAGVVYSEMQARENSGQSRVWLEMFRSLFRKPSGYSSETGGIMKNLRESTTIEKIRSYHKAVYRPENLHVIISGQIEPEKVFKALEPVEAKILAKGDRGPFSRPWETSLAPLLQSEDREIYFASDAEDTGSVNIGWRGPSVVGALEEFQSMEVLMEYLTKSSISILQQTFIEIAEPLASVIEKDMLQFSTSGICLYFEGVPSNKTDEIAPLLKQTLQKLLSGEISLDLKRMKNILKYTISREENALESEPHETVAKQIISHVLYGYSKDFIDSVVNKGSRMLELFNKDESYWLALLKKYLVDAPSIVIRGVPSIGEAKRLQNEELARVAERKSSAGEHGLKNFGELVSGATKQNEIPPPDAILENFPIASVDSIKFHPLRIYSNLLEVASSERIYSASGKYIDLGNVDVKMQLNDVKSNFVQLTAILDCSSLSVSEKSYLPLLLDLLLESPLLRGSTIIPHDEVVQQLQTDTFVAETVSGVSLRVDEPFSFGRYFSNVAVNFKLERENYVKGIQWLKDILFNVDIRAERIKVKAGKLLTSITEFQRKGRKVLNIMQNYILFRPDSPANTGNFLRQANVLKKILLDLESNPSLVVKSLQHVYKSISQPNNISVQVSTDLEKLVNTFDFESSWKNFFGDMGSPSDYRLNIMNDGSYLNDPLGNSYIAALGSLESAFLFQTTRSIDNFQHEDIPALKIAIAYLTQLEGPMWKDIRGKGLAYHSRIILDPSEGLLKLHLGYAAQLAEAYKESIKLLSFHINNPDLWSPLLFESGKSSLMYEVINQQGYVSDVIQLAIYNQYNNVTLEYHSNILKRISATTIDEVKAAAVKYLTPLIDSKTSSLSVVCPPSKLSEIKTELEKFGHQLQTTENIRQSIFAEI